MLSALRSGRALLLRAIPGSHFCQWLSELQGRNAAGTIRLTERKENPITSSGFQPGAFRFVA
jgi:hypothetical protein